MPLDWSKIEAWEKFQRLTNALFSSEINDPAFFQPSNPYIGADGGWDGRHQGAYPPEGLKEGLYSIQSKFTTQTGQDAFNFLKSALKGKGKGKSKEKGEIEKAEEHNVDYLRISTNAELKIDQINKLEKLAEGTRLKDIKIWYREHLSLRIARNPFIAYYFFGNAQFPAFVPPQIHFTQDEKGLTSFSCLEIKKFKEYILRFQEFVVSDSKRILFVYGPGGHGKSHLLREIADNSIKFDSERRVLFFRTTRDPQVAFGDELVAGNKYLLIFDDAERNLDEVEKILKSVSTGAIDAKLILSFRAAGYSLITKTVIGQKFSTEPVEIKIDHWTAEELTHLLRITSGQPKVKDEEEIVKQFPNPYLIVLMGNKIKNNPLVSKDELKGKILQDLKHDASIALGISIDQAEAFLFIIACLAPFWLSNAQHVASTAGLSEEKFNEYVQKLISAGVLRKVGNTVRFDPDMKGDMFLANYLSKKSPTEIKDAVLELIEVSPENVFSNIGSAFLDEEEKNVVEGILSELICSWVRDSSTTPIDQKKKRLQIISRIGFLIPDDALNLISAFLDENQPTKGFLTTDDFGPAILHLTRSAVTKNSVDILECILKLTRNVLTGTYDNYKPTRITERAFSPVFQDIQTIDARLDVLDQWTNKNIPNSPTVLRDALSEVLGATHEFDRSFPGKIEFGERFLLDLPITRALRAKALALLEKILKSGDSTMAEAGVWIAREIGRTHRGNISGRSVPLNDCFPAERQRVAEIIKERVKTEKDLKVLNDFEDLILVWWAQDIDGVSEDLLVETLRLFPRTAEYLLLRHVYSHEYVVEDLERMFKTAPAKDRWPWFVDKVMSVRWNRQPQEFENLVKDISHRINTPDSIAVYLAEIGKILPADGHKPRPLFIHPWVEVNQKTFLQIRNDPALWSRIPSVFQYEIDGAIGEKDPNHIRKLADEIISKLPDVQVNRTSQVVYLSNRLPAEEQSKIIKAIAEKGSSWSRGQLMMDLYSVYQARKDTRFVIDLANFSLEHGLPDERVLDNLSFFWHSLKDLIDKEPEKKKALCDNAIRVLKDIPHLSWNENNLLSYCTENFDDLLALIMHRLRKSRAQGFSFEYEAIPFEGLKIVGERITSYAQFKDMMDKLASLASEGEGITPYELNRLVGHLVSKKNKLSGNSYLVDYIKELLSRAQIGQAIEAAQHLPLSQEVSDLFLEIGATGIASGLVDEVRSMFFSKVHPERGISYTPGEPPLVLVNIKTQFESLIQKIPAGNLKAILNDCIQYVENSIKGFEREDEED